MKGKAVDRFIKHQQGYAAAWAASRKLPPPPFSWGASWVEPGAGNEDATTIERAVADWRTDPRVWFTKLGSPAVTEVSQAELLVQPARANGPGGRQHRASVFSRRLSTRITGGRIAVIIVPQWNPRHASYLRKTRITQVTMMPLSTFVYMPQGDNGHVSVANHHEVDYETVSPNIGKTLQRFRSDVVNIVALARYLKEVERYEKVGLFSYSIGSSRALPAYVVSPGLFDYAVFHLVADDFAEAVLRGASTQAIANVIRQHLSDGELRRVWRPLSPGAYVEYFSIFGPTVRLVQGKYDLAFGMENTHRFTDSLRAHARAGEIEEGEYGHYYTWREWPLAFGMLQRDLRFIYRVTGLKYWR